MDMQVPPIFDSLAEAVAYGETLSDPIKSEILMMLSKAPMDANSLAAKLRKPLTTVMYHIGLLVKNGLVREEQQGRVKLYEALLPVFIADENLDADTKPLIISLGEAIVSSYVELANEERGIMSLIAERCAGGGYTTESVKTYLLLKSVARGLSQIVGRPESYLTELAKAVEDALKSASRSKLLEDLSRLAGSTEL